MNLYLMRHANAGVRRDNPLLDVRRGLVKEGKEQCVQIARVLNAQGIQMDAILSSPLKRSLQTAQFVGNELGFDGNVESEEALAPGADYAAFQAMLAKYADRENVLVVGHNPTLHQFLGKLVTGNGGANIRLRKGSIARVDMERRPPQLMWHLDIRLARALYASVTKSSRPKTKRK